MNPGSLWNAEFSNNCRTVFFDCCIFISFSRLDLVQKYHLLRPLASSYSKKRKRKYLLAMEFQVGIMLIGLVDLLLNLYIYYSLFIIFIKFIDLLFCRFLLGHSVGDIFSSCGFFYLRHYVMKTISVS